MKCKIMTQNVAKLEKHAIEQGICVPLAIAVHALLRRK